MRTRMAYKVVFIAIFTASLARADEFKDFVLVNTSATPAYGMEVETNRQLDKDKIRSNHISTGDVPPKAAGQFNKATPAPIVPPRLGPLSVYYTMPVDNMGDPSMVPQGYSVKFGLEILAGVANPKGFNLVMSNGRLNTNTTYFTDMKGNKINNSTRLVAANMDLNQDPSTAVVSVSTGNSTGDFLFLTDIQIWTGLTVTQALSFDVNGDYLTSALPPTPTYTPADITLSSSQVTGPSIPLAVLPYGSYVVVLYNLSDGPDSNISNSTPFGQFIFSSDVTVPEPSTFALMAAASVGLLCYRRCLRNRKIAS